jgi:hypothetical protein
LGRDLLCDLRGVVFAVIVYNHQGKFTWIILLQQRSNRLSNGIGFVAGWDDGDYTGPVWRWRMMGLIVVEWAQTPEEAAG